MKKKHIPKVCYETDNLLNYVTVAMYSNQNFRFFHPSDKTNHILLLLNVYSCEF